MDASHIKGLFDARMHAVSELRRLDEAAAGREFTAEEAEQYRKINEAIDSYDERITNGLAAIERERKADEARAAFEAIARPEGREQAQDDDAEALRALVRGERRSVEFLPTQDEARALVKGTGSAGGDLVPTSMYARLVQSMEEHSTVMRANATVIQTAGGEDIVVPKVVSTSAAAIVNEAAQIGTSEPSFDTVTLGAYKYGFIAYASPELLSDSAFDVVSFLAAQGGQALGDGTGAHFISGDGTGKPHGVAAAATVGKTTASASAITPDEVIDVFHSVRSPYRSTASWVFADSTLAVIRKLKDGNDQYLWQPGLQAGQPDTLLGRPVLTDPAVPSIDAGAVVGIFGDLSGYFVRLAGPVRIERSDHFKFDTDLVAIRFLVRADGDLVDTHAVKTLKMADA